MKKSSVIALSLVLVFLVLIGVTFGTVFCLRTQTVSLVGDFPLSLTSTQIIEAGNLKKGQSIFLINKEKAIENIEKTYPEIKVIQIKTVSLVEIDIRVRARVEMFYTEFNDKFYVMDEELKVLEIINKTVEPEPSNEPINLSYIKADFLNVNAETKLCDFLGDDFKRKTTYALYNATINTFKKGELDEKEYYTRTDVNLLIRNLEFYSDKTYDKIIITTNFGVKLDIENPLKNLTNKMNICYSTIESFITEENNKEKSGTIKIFYDLENVQKCIYILET